MSLTLLRKILVVDILLINKYYFIFNICIFVCPFLFPLYYIFLTSSFSSVFPLCLYLFFFSLFRPFQNLFSNFISVFIFFTFLFLSFSLSLSLFFSTPFPLIILHKQSFIISKINKYYISQIDILDNHSINSYNLKKLR